MAANNGDSDDIWRQRFEEVLACLDAAIVGDRPPRYHKLDFPKFDGHGDPLPFLNRCEQFFRVNAHQKMTSCGWLRTITSMVLNSGTPVWNKIMAHPLGVVSPISST